MSAKRDEDKKDPRFPWTARQRRQKTGGRQARKKARNAYKKRVLKTAPRRR